MDGVETVDVLVEFYFKLGFNHKEILHLLAFYNGIVISIRSLRRLLAKMGLFRRKSYSNILDVAMFIMEQVEKSGQLHGYINFYT